MTCTHQFMSLMDLNKPCMGIRVLCVLCAQAREVFVNGDIVVLEQKE